MSVYQTLPNYVQPFPNFLLVRRMLIRKNLEFSPRSSVPDFLTNKLDNFRLRRIYSSLSLILSNVHHKYCKKFDFTKQNPFSYQKKNVYLFNLKLY